MYLVAHGITLCKAYSSLAYSCNSSRCRTVGGPQARKETHKMLLLGATYSHLSPQQRGLAWGRAKSLQQRQRINRRIPSSIKNAGAIYPYLRPQQRGLSYEVLIMCLLRVAEGVKASLGLLFLGSFFSVVGVEAPLTMVDAAAATPIVYATGLKPKPKPKHKKKTRNPASPRPSRWRSSAFVRRTSAPPSPRPASRTCPAAGR